MNKTDWLIEYENPNYIPFEGGMEYKWIKVKAYSKESARQEANVTLMRVYPSLFENPKIKRVLTESEYFEGLQ